MTTPNSIIDRITTKIADAISNRKDITISRYGDYLITINIAEQVKRSFIGHIVVREDKITFVTDWLIEHLWSGKPAESCVVKISDPDCIGRLLYLIDKAVQSRNECITKKHPIAHEAEPWT